jgi:hypothetical protein
MTPEVNPYELPAGPDLDRLVHMEVMGGSAKACPPYSTDEKAARQVLAKLKSFPGRTVVTGRTALRRKRWFARYQSDASDGTEVLAETLALAICRLALLRAISKEKS